MPLMHLLVQRTLFTFASISTTLFSSSIYLFFVCEYYLVETLRLVLLFFGLLEIHFQVCF